jgi:hypothetical protein
MFLEEEFRLTKNIQKETIENMAQEIGASLVYKSRVYIDITFPNGKVSTVKGKDKAYQRMYDYRRRLKVV